MSADLAHKVPHAQVLAVSLICLMLGAAAYAQVTIEDPGTFVVDTAEIIDASTEQKLNAMLKELEDKTTAQLKVLTVRSVQGEDWFGFVQRHAETWRLGRENKDNGALIALSVEDRQVRIQTGYGLEGPLPDSWCGSAGRSVAQQYFKQGAYSEGLYRLTVMTANKVADEYSVKLSGVPAYRFQPQTQSNAPSFCWFAFILFWLIAGMGGARARRARGYRRWGGGPGGLLAGMLLGSALGGRRSGWSGGGGLGGGFGGGFGGGSFGRGGGFGGGGGGASW